MEQHTTTISHGNGRRAAVNALAAVGFIALIFVGITLAIYAARYVPTALSRLSAAAVSLSEDFIPGFGDREDGLDAIPFDFDADDEATSTPETQEDAEDEGAEDTGTNTGTGGGTQPPPTPIVTPVPVPVEPFGLADLTVVVDAVGYCTSSSPSSFRTSTRVPDGERGGIKFTVRNIGTNVAPKSEMEIELPTSPSYTQRADVGSMNPNDARVFTLCFDRPRDGDNRRITVTVDSDDDIEESNERNNEASRTIDIED